MRRKLLVFAQFVLVSLIIGTTYWSGAFDARQLFHFLHGWHSILTLGTVVAVDFLLFTTGWTSTVRKNLVEYFPVMSRAIWTGLAIDFASVALIYSEAFEATPKFFFAQTVVGIIILNGALLSGPITERLKTGVSSRWQAIALVSGVVSIVSWTTITALDAFEGLQLGYSALAGIYAAVIAAGILVLGVASRYSRHFAL